MYGGSRLYAALPDWRQLERSLTACLQQHGNWLAWQAAVDQIPVAVGRWRCDAGQPEVRVEGHLKAAAIVALRRNLQALHPWRKGPFNLLGIALDAEWRSDFKWRRLAPALALNGKRVLDVGSGNGWFGWQMLAAGADLVVGIDANPLCHMQHQAVARLADEARNWVLPARFESIPQQLFEGRFDTVFSMGVLYHQRQPLQHLQRLRSALAPAGEAIVETLVVEATQPLAPPGRYARMRNVYQIPTPALLTRWLRASGFDKVRLLDISRTTAQEQRSTDWMRFQSLEAGLNPSDPAKTLEGHPAPRRCLALARLSGQPADRAG